jgi:hypothetical protein
MKVFYVCRYLSMAPLAKGWRTDDSLKHLRSAVSPIPEQRRLFYCVQISPDGVVTADRIHSNGVTDAPLNHITASDLLLEINFLHHVRDGVIYEGEMNGGSPS